MRNGLPDAENVTRPRGVFEEYYDRVFTPEEILLEIETVKSWDPEGALLREKLFRYRFYTRKEMGREITSDRFIAFWTELMFFDKTVSGNSKFRLKLAEKKLSGMFENKKLSAIFGGKWPDARVLYEQLYNAARRYFFTCQTDRTYTSNMFGFSAIKRPLLMEKIVADFFDAALCFAWRCGLLQKYPFVGRAALDAWLREFEGREETVVDRVKKNMGETAAAEIMDIVSRA